MKFHPINDTIEACSRGEDGKCVRCGFDCAPLNPKSFHICSSGKQQLAGYEFWCPACKSRHFFRTVAHPHVERLHVWRFNGDLENPTFAPSLQWGEVGKPGACHLTLEGGIIKYAPDEGCQHAMRGMQVPMEEIPNA